MTPHCITNLNPALGDAPLLPDLLTAQDLDLRVEADLLDSRDQHLAKHGKLFEVPGLARDVLDV